MNKDDYIKELDNIKAPESLKQKISETQKQHKKKKIKPWKFAAIAAALVIVFVGISPAFSGASKSDSAQGIADSYNANEDYAQVDESAYETYSKSEAAADSVQNTSSSSGIKTDRKIVRNASLYVETKDLNKFIESIDAKTDALGGYNESAEIDNYNSATADLVIRIPAEKLDDFIAAVDEIATVQSKSISAADITDSYTDVESHIKALETEETALLKILENCKTVSETIEVQNRLSQVRSELDGYKTQIKNYDSQIAYSRVAISVSEESRIIKSDDSFSSRLKAKFEDSVYNIGNFFESFAVNILGGILYIIIAAVIIFAAVLIIKKIKKKRI